MIACLGEHLSEREGGKTEEIVTQQMKAIAGMCVGGGEEEGGRGCQSVHCKRRKDQLASFGAQQEKHKSHTNTWHYIIITSPK